MGEGALYHEKGPDGVVEEDDGCGHKHGETDEFIELVRELAVVFSLMCVEVGVMVISLDEGGIGRTIVGKRWSCLSRCD